MSLLSCPAAERARKFIGPNLRGMEDAEIARTFRSWVSMLGRCFIPGERGGDNYRGRGVTVCERWFDFARFAEDMGPRPDGTTLDRIDPTGHYEPGNCRWSDKFTQAQNTRRTKRIQVDGVAVVQSVLARLVGVSDATIMRRTRAGKPMAEVLSSDPLRTGKLMAEDVTAIRALLSQGLTNVEIGRRFGVTHSAISMIRRGVTWRST